MTTEVLQMANELAGRIRFLEQHIEDLRSSDDKLVKLVYHFNGSKDPNLNSNGIDMNHFPCNLTFKKGTKRYNRLIKILEDELAETKEQLNNL